jgi:Ca-activated chloride channel family protein
VLSLERPLVLLGGLAALAFAAWLRRRLRRGRALPRPLGPPGGAVFAPPAGGLWPVRLAGGLEIAAYLASVLAAAGPVALSTQTVYLARGADIVFVLDASASMSARDMDGASRFEMAVSLIRDFSAARGADAIGLVAVGSDAALLAPPTIDRFSLAARLDTLRIAELGDGTALGLGLSIAALHLRSAAAPRKAVVLLTDGENNTGAVHPQTGAAAVRAVGASLWVIGIGSAGEVLIDYVDPATGARRRGLLDSRFDPAALKAIAQAGGGVYLHAPAPDSFRRAFAALDAQEYAAGATRTVTRSTGLGDPLIVGALAALALSRLIRRFLLGALP